MRGGREAQEEGDIHILTAASFVVQQTLTQHKAIILHKNKWIKKSPFKHIYYGKWFLFSI